MTVGKVLNNIKEIDTIITSFNKASISNATEQDIKEALYWMNFKAVSYLLDYRNYLCNLEIKEEDD